MNMLLLNISWLFMKHFEDFFTCLYKREHNCISGTQPHLCYLSDHLPSTHSRQTAQPGPMGHSTNLHTAVAGPCLWKDKQTKTWVLSAQYISHWYVYCSTDILQILPCAVQSCVMISLRKTSGAQKRLDITFTVTQGQWCVNDFLVWEITTKWCLHDILYHLNEA